jgi:tight adherence protein B
MEWAISIGLFFAAVLIIEGILFLLRSKWDRDMPSPEKRLEKFTASETQQSFVDIVRRRSLSDVPKLHAMLSKIPLMRQLDHLVIQANVRWPLGVFVLVSLVLFLTCYLLFSVLTRGIFIPVIIGFLAGMIPFFYLYVKKQQRIKKFERQLPDALDLMARSLRAGHAFSGGLQMVGEEFDDPIGVEFLRVMNEINYGASVDQALLNLNQRVDMPDLKFFTVSILIQRESGGNLAEILESIGRLIRERFKLQGKIRTLSAEGKLSAIILIGLPFFVVLVLSFMNPDYLPVLFQDPMGKMLVAGALCMMGFGVYIIKRLINIRV